MQTRGSSLLVLMLLGSWGSLEAEDDWTWPEKPQNLRILPSDWSGERLRPVMVGFTKALGVRCDHCHVGTEGKSLATFDFASDDNPNKNRAREMLEMLGSINEHLDRIEPSGPERVNLWCHTCHRGQSRPMTLEEELNEAGQLHGPVGLAERYRSLRDRYYGRGTYDFDEAVLNRVGYQFLEAERLEIAIAAFRLNVEFHSDSANAHDSLAEAYATAGDRERAIVFFRKSLELNPDNQNAADQLARLRSGDAG